MSSSSLSSSSSSGTQQQQQREEAIQQQSVEEKEIQLSPDQEFLRNHDSMITFFWYVVHVVRHTKLSVFFTGAAGYGKSALLKKIIAACDGEDDVVVTATTGIAACALGGRTLHSWAGIGLGTETAKVLANKILFIVPEDSSFYDESKHSYRFYDESFSEEVSMMSAELLDKLDEIARFVRPKQGHLPFGGIQLVLVGDLMQLPAVKAGKTTLLDAKAWKSVVQLQCQLTEPFRQRDPVFLGLLAQVRTATIDAKTEALLKSLDRELPPRKDGIEPTRLYVTNKDVDAENSMRLAELHGDPLLYESVETGEDDMKEQLNKACLAPRLLKLKVGAQVMCVKNGGGLFNGQRGRVVEFTGEGPYQVPVVQFTNMSEPIAVHHTTFEYLNGQGKIVATRRQLPLKLAWAITVHKSQGMTIDYLHINMHGTFEFGQAYVALSRATCMDGVQVTGYNRKYIMANPTLIEYYKTLPSVQQIRNENKALVTQINKAIANEVANEAKGGGENKQPSKQAKPMKRKTTMTLPAVDSMLESMRASLYSSSSSPHPESNQVMIKKPIAQKSTCSGQGQCLMPRIVAGATMFVKNPDVRCSYACIPQACLNIGTCGACCPQWMLSNAQGYCSSACSNNVVLAPDG